MWQPSKWTAHPILFSTYPILLVYSEYMSEIPTAHLVLPIVIVTAATIAIWIATGMILRSITKGAMAASLSVVFFLLYANFHLVCDLIVPWPLDARYTRLSWLVFYTTGILAIVLVHGRIVTKASRAADVFALTLTLAVCVPIARFAVSSEQVTQKPLPVDIRKATSTWRGTSGKHPSIYCIVLDGYGRADVLAQHYGFDNSEFIFGLKDKGFFVADKSTSNYSTTGASLSSLLNMNYDRQLSIDNSLVAQILKSMDYRYVFIPSGYNITNRSSIADLTVDVGTYPRTELSALLLESSVIAFPFRLMTPLDAAIQQGLTMDLSGRSEWHRHITRSLEAIGSVADMDGPSFTFAHICCPHAPYVFNRDGTLNMQSKMSDLSDTTRKQLWRSSQYVEQVVHLNKLINSMVDTILANSQTSPIIILLGDHGTFYTLTDDSKANPSPENIQERMSNLFACYAPPVILDDLYETITPVNVFRIIFDRHFGAHYGQLEDRNYWSYVEPCRDVTSVIGWQYAENCGS